MSVSGQAEAARNVTGSGDVAADAIVSAVELISDQISAHAELGEAAVVVAAAGVQV